jgi:two-component system, sporulation sensor kinase A
MDQFFSSAFHNAPIGMCLSDIDGHWIKVNPAFCKLIGYSEEEVLNLSFKDITHPEDLGVYLVGKEQLFNGHVNSFEVEKRYIHKSRKTIWVVLNVSLVRDHNGLPSHQIVQIMDITDKKRNEELMLNSEKLSVVGELAAGIAHEIRNPLTSLRGFVQLFQKEDTSDTRKLYHDVMLSEIDRINEIVSELLVLAKPGNETYGLGSIVDKLNHVVTLFEGQANLYNVQINKEFDTYVPLIRSQSSLKQVFLNILKNAIESMPNGGEVLIQTKRMDDKVCVRIIDKGCGIPQDKLSKIGKPFFTTKDNGTGLGLMVSQRIIQNHKGTMRIESEVGRGTTVEILLPVNMVDID